MLTIGLPSKLEYSLGNFSAESGGKNAPTQRGYNCNLGEHHI